MSYNTGNCFKFFFESKIYLNKLIKNIPYLELKFKLLQLALKYEKYLHNFYIN